jgi:hypothetical protein
MWWLWPHFRRIWAATGAIALGLVVNYLFAVWGRQSVPSLHDLSSLLYAHLCLTGSVLRSFAIVSLFAERAHRRREAPHFIGEIRGRQGAKALPLPTSSTTPSTLIVGRDGELTQLRELFASVRERERRVVFVSGEAGIGKTAFVNKFVDSLGRDGVRIARGQCVEQYGAGEPYMPVLEALTQLGRGAEGPHLLAILHRLAPAWLAQLPALLTVEERAQIHGETQGLTQQRMLREMAGTLAELAADEPLVILLEDLHWSDASTLDLIGAIARRTEPARLLILGTYRPVEMLAGDHPLRALKEELEVHRQCQELRLKLLNETAVATYLARRFAEGKESAILRFTQNDKKGLLGNGDAQRLDDEGSSTLSFRSERSAERQEGNPGSLTQIVPLVYQRTEGNALFMVNVVDYLVAQGPQFDASKLEAPRNIRQMIERNLERLTTDDQAVLESASVVGAEFSAAAVAAALKRPAIEIDTCCSRLSRNEQFIQSQGQGRWPDGTLVTGYRFLHALYQEVLYDRVPVVSRAEAHRRIAVREESAYGERADEIAGELANHYSRARDNDKAVKYFQLAGERAAARGAMVEAAGQDSRALELLRETPASGARDRQELALQIGLGAALWGTKSWSHSEAHSTFTRAQELAEKLGETQQLISILFGLWGSAVTRGQISVSLEFAQRMLRIAESSDDRGLLCASHATLGYALSLAAKLADAQKHLELSSSYFDEDDSRKLTGDGGVLSAAGSPQLALFLGFPDRARRLIIDALRLADAARIPTTWGSFYFTLAVSTGRYAMHRLSLRMRRR